MIGSEQIEPIKAPQKQRNDNLPDIPVATETEENIDYEIFEADEIDGESPELTVGGDNVSTFIRILLQM